MLHTLRTQGNVGVHRFSVDARDATHTLRIARQVGVWFHRAFRSPGAQFKPGPFVVPVAYNDVDAARRQVDEMARIRVDLQAARDEVAAERQQRLQAQTAVEVQTSERQVWQQLAQSEEAERKRLEAEFDLQLRAIRQSAAATSGAATPAGMQAVALAIAQSIAQSIHPGHQVNRSRRGRDPGPDRPSTARRWLGGRYQVLRHARSARPQASRNLAIAEWPTTAGPADYVLFCGLGTCPSARPAE